MKYVAATDAGQSASFAAEGRMGAAYILNQGAEDVYFSFDAVPANTNADGRTRLPSGEAFALDDCLYTTIGFRCPAALTTDVFVVGLPRPGSSGVGFG